MVGPKQVEPMTTSPPSTKWSKKDKKMTFRLIADTLGIPKTVVLRILRGDLKKRQRHGAFDSNNSTVSDSKTLNHPHILARFVSPDFFLLPKVKLQLKSARFDTIE